MISVFPEVEEFLVMYDSWEMRRRGAQGQRVA
jgi:hypothetical protein